MKKTIITLLAIMLAAQAWALDFKVGDLYYHTNGSTNTVIVTSSNYYYEEEYHLNYAYKDYKWTSDWKKRIHFLELGGRLKGLKTNNKLKSVDIPEQVTYQGKTYTVTKIADLAFANHKALTSVNIPNTIITIGEYAFCGCENLKSISIPESVEYIGKYALQNCTETEFQSIKSVCEIDYKHNPFGFSRHLIINGKEITDLVVPDNIKSISGYAFFGCDYIKSIAMYGVKNIGNEAFYSCDNLESINSENSKAILYGVETIGELAFYNCKFKSIYIPESVRKIGKCAFRYCKAIIYCVSNKYSYGYFWNCYSTSYYKGETTCDRELRVIRGVTPLFSDFAIQKVTAGLNEWMQKGEFEKVADWHQRVNNETRNKKIKELTIKAEKEYIEKSADKHTPYVLGTYDTENEVFLISNAKYGKMLVPVPFDKASGFRQQWELITEDVKYLIDNDTISVASVTFTLPNGEQYTYNSKASLNYEVAQVNYNFAPIEIAAPTSESKGNQTITTTQRTIGVSDIDTNLPISNEKQDNTFAVIIANENYQKEAQVPFATNDGRTFAEYCKKTMGIPDNNIHIATDATLNNMKYEINWLKQVIEAYNGNARVIFYYAGHGIPDESAKTAYLLPVDGFGNDVSTGYKLDDLYSTLGNLPSKSVTVFLDACFSGANRSGEMLASARGVAIKAKNSAPVGNMVVFSAAQGDETAYPNNEQQHGMFTYYLLKKIKETAGNVTYKELGDYVTDNVRKQSIVVNGKSQTPTIVPSTTIGSTWETWKLK